MVGRIGSVSRWQQAGGYSRRDRRRYDLPLATTSDSGDRALRGRLAHFLAGQCDGVVLQEISNCAAANWTNTTNAVALVNNKNQVLINHNAGNRFYRLVSH